MNIRMLSWFALPMLLLLSGCTGDGGSSSLREGLPAFALEAYLKASNTESQDDFGRSVAIYGDTLVIGAPDEDSGIAGTQSDNSASNAGAVYVFTRSGVSWTFQAYLKASTPGAGDNFGASVAISGDTLVVGASAEDSGNGADQTDNTATDAGAVYVFTRSGVTWSQQAYVKPTTIGAGDGFGTSVSVDGDTLVVGAPSEDSGVVGTPADNSAADAGAAYVFTRSAGSWSQQAYVKASNVESGDAFGSSVSVSGDTLAVGARREDGNGVGVNPGSVAEADNSVSDSGAVYVFTRLAGNWTQQAYLKASNTGAGDEFGTSLSLESNTLAVGSPLEDSNATGTNGNQINNAATNSGAVYVFSRAGTSWSQQTYLKAPNTEIDDNLGMALSLSGDTLVVGASGEDSAATGIGGSQVDNSAIAAGAAFVFR